MHANIGRPSGYCEAIADQILEYVGEGQSIRTICAKPDMPAKATVFKWLATFPPFADQYARAREACVERWAEEIVELADAPIEAMDNAAVQRARLRVDTRKWLMSKLAPRKYGDRVEHVIKTGNAADLTDDELARIAAASAPALLTAPTTEVVGSTAGTDPDTDD